MKLGKEQEVERLKKITELADFSFVYTKPPYGNGGALQSVRHLVEKEPFILVWSDEVIVSKKRPRIRQVLDVFEKYGKPTVSAVKIEDKSKRGRYGMAQMKDIPGEVETKEIVRIVEKPKMEDDISDYAAHGAYALTPEVFTALDRTPTRNGELWLTDILNKMREDTGLLAKIISDGNYLDCGDPVSYLYSQIDYFLNYSEYSNEILKYLDKKVCERKT
jgi:UTP--glucose-1-phosphate uridylyltransferase